MAGTDPMHQMRMHSEDKKKRLCIVPTCKDERFDLVHKFPMDGPRAEEWRQALDVPLIYDMDIDVIRKRYFVCARHFQASDYKNHTSRSLNKTSIPSVNLKKLDNIDALERAKAQSINSEGLNNDLCAFEENKITEKAAVKSPVVPVRLPKTKDAITITKANIPINVQTIPSHHVLNKNSTLKRILTEERDNSVFKKKKVLALPNNDVKVLNLDKGLIKYISPAKKNPVNDLTVKKMQPITQKLIKIESIQTPNAKTKVIPKINDFVGEDEEKINPSDLPPKNSDTVVNEPPKLLALFQLTPENLLNMQQQLSTNSKNILTSRNYKETVLDDNLIDLLTNKTSVEKNNNENDENMDYLELQNPDLETLKINYFWLRDHCRCSKCYNEENYQRLINVLDIPLSIKPNACEVIDDELKVIWDDGHVSSYNLDFLYGNPLKKTLEPPSSENGQILWDESLINAARANLNDLLCDDDVAKSIVRSLIIYGVAFIDKCPANEMSTEVAIKRLFPIQKTLFGEMWTFTDNKDHSDSAYSKEYLAPHTDNTYFNDAAGLQILHCIQHNGTGGENLLVDGFKVLKDLKENNLETFNRLSEISIPSEYIESDKHHKYCAPMIKRNPVTDNVEQIRFNLYDRAPLNTIEPEKLTQFYSDLRILTKSMYDVDNQWKFKLNPGTILIFDNWRVLHGRHEYTGKRVMTGCYVSRTDFMSVARTMKIIE